MQASTPLTLRHRVPEMADQTSDSDLTQILRDTKVIACVGMSTNPMRPSYFVARYMHYRGYRIIPVNPVYAGQSLLGEPIVGSLADCPPEVDMVDIFRKPDAVPAIVDEALEHLPNLKCIWMQIGVTHPAAAAQARSHGVQVVEDRCPKIESQRLFGELRRAGFNTGIISSKLPDW